MLFIISTLFCSFSLAAAVVPSPKPLRRALTVPLGNNAWETAVDISADKVLTFLAQLPGVNMDTPTSIALPMRTFTDDGDVWEHQNPKLHISVEATSPQQSIIEFYHGNKVWFDNKQVTENLMMHI